MRRDYINPKISFDEAIADSQAEDVRVIERPVKPLIFKLTFSFLMMLALVVFGRAATLAVGNHDLYARKAAGNINKEISITAPRGIITDRFGKPLASNKLVFSAFLNVSEMVQNGEQAEAEKAVLAILGAESAAELAGKLKSADLEKTTDIKLAEDISPEQAIRFADRGLKSVYIEKDYKREYLSIAASHAVGYVGLPRKEDLVGNPALSLVDSIGRSGLEAYYDDELRGINGKRIIYRDAALRTQEVNYAREPQIGKTLKTTIDLGLQEYFYGSLLRNMNLRGQKAGVGIALNPQNGEVLAMVSLPAFDPAKIGSYLKLPNQPLFNRAISGVYNPGSTIKPFHAAAALKEGVLAPHTGIFSRGYIEVPNPYNPAAPGRYVDWKAHGWIDVYSAIARSSNIFFYAAIGGLTPNEAGIVNGAYRSAGVGIEKINDYWRKFGFGSQAGIDLVGEGKSLLPNPAEKEKRTKLAWRIGDTYNISIGQGDLLITPLQLLNGIASIANHGKAFRPHLNLEAVPKVLFDNPDLASELAEVEKGMIDAVYKSYGTGHILADIPMKLAVKTGSAQVNFNTKTNALVAAYGPADNPEIAVLVLIEDAKEGSLNALPIAKDVLQWYYDNRIASESVPAR